MLEKIEMAPTLFIGVIGLGPLGATYRAGKETAHGKADGNVQPAFLKRKPDTPNLPGWGESQGKIEQGRLVHDGLLCVVVETS